MLSTNRVYNTGTNTNTIYDIRLNSPYISTFRLVFYIFVIPDFHRTKRHVRTLKVKYNPISRTIKTCVTQTAPLRILDIYTCNIVQSHTLQFYSIPTMIVTFHRLTYWSERYSFSKRCQSTHEVTIYDYYRRSETINATNVYYLFKRMLSRSLLKCTRHEHSFVLTLWLKNPCLHTQKSPQICITLCTLRYNYTYIHTQLMHIKSIQTFT